MVLASHLPTPAHNLLQVQVDTLLLGRSPEREPGCETEVFNFVQGSLFFQKLEGSFNFLLKYLFAQRQLILTGVMQIIDVDSLDAQVGQRGLQLILQEGGVQAMDAVDHIVGSDLALTDQLAYELFLSFLRIEIVRNIAAFGTQEQFVSLISDGVQIAQSCSYFPLAPHVLVIYCCVDHVHCASQHALNYSVKQTQSVLLWRTDIRPHSH